MHNTVRKSFSGASIVITVHQATPSYNNTYAAFEGQLNNLTKNIKRPSPVTSKSSRHKQLALQVQTKTYTSVAVNMCLGSMVASCIHCLLHSIGPIGFGEHLKTSSHYFKIFQATLHHLPSALESQNTMQQMSSFEWEHRIVQLKT